MRKKIISSILKNNNWYIDLDSNIVISILIDLGYSNDESIKIYKYLLTIWYFY